MHESVSPRGVVSAIRLWIFVAGFATVLSLDLGVAVAQESGIAIELNKLEPQGQGCRAYFVVGNKTKTAYEELKLDLVLFRPDGVIGQALRSRSRAAEAREEIGEAFRHRGHGVRSGWQLPDQRRDGMQI